MRFLTLFSIFIVSMLCLFMGAQSQAQSSANGLVYHGRIIKPNGSPLQESAVSFTLKVYGSRLSGPAKRCLLYQETQTKNLSGSIGVFELLVGEGTREFPSVAIDGGITRLFLNSTNHSLTATCTNGDTSFVSDSAYRDRELEVTINTATDQIVLPAQSLRATPWAMQAFEVGGYSADYLAKLVSVDTTLPVGLALPYMTIAQRDAYSADPDIQKGIQIFNTDSNLVNFWDGTNWVETGSGSGSVTSITAGTGLTGGTITATGTIAVNVGTGPNQIVQLDATSKIPALDGSLLTALTRANVAAGTANHVLINGGTGLLSSEAQLALSRGGTGVNASTTAPTFAGLILTDTTTGAGLQLQGSTSGTVTVRAPTTVTNYSFTLPDAVASTGQVLTALDAAGRTTWTSVPSTAATFVQNGNSFTALATLGTNDNFGLAFETNGTEQMRILADGSVGIGTVSPTGKLDVEGGTAYLPAPEGAPVDGNLAVNQFAFYTENAGNKLFVKAKDSNGDVISKELTAAGSSAVSGLTAAIATNTIDSLNFAQVWDWSSLSTQTAMTTNADAITSGKVRSIASTATAFTGVMSDITLSGDNAANTGTLEKLSVTGAASAAVPLMLTNLGTGSSFRVNDETGDADATPFIIDASGKVGIGTTAPAYLLDVNAASNGGASARIANMTGTVGIQPTLRLIAGANIDNSGGKLVLSNQGAPTGQDVALANIRRSGIWGMEVLGNSDSSLLRVSNSGNVGIGTTTPVSKFQVGAAPTANANFPLFALGTAPFDGTTAGFFTGHANGTFIGVNAAAGYTGDFANFQVNGVTRYKIDSSGNITTSGASSGTGNISTTGDISTTGTGTVTSAGAMMASSGTASTSTSTGALIVTGGAGISGALNVGSNVIANGNISAAAGTAATVGANQSSPNLNLSANYWNGASAVDQWSIQNILGTGANPTSTLQFGHSGSSGNARYAFMNGNVGIGTVNPTDKLDVEGGSAYLPAQDAVPADVNLAANQYVVYLDQAADKVYLKAKETGGTVHIKEIGGTAGLTTLATVTDGFIPMFATTTSQLTNSSLQDEGSGVIDIGNAAGRIEMNDVFFAHVGGGTDNTFLGLTAGDTIAAGGTYNTGVGKNALTALTTGDRNTAIGASSQSAATGSDNTSLGYGALLQNSGTKNTIIGSLSSINLGPSSGNTAIGADSLLYSTDGTNNTVIGEGALEGVSTYSGTSGNVAIGKDALTGAADNFVNNTVVGTSTGTNATTSSSGNIFLGYSAGPSTPGDTDNKLYIDNEASDTPLIYGDFSTNAVTINGNFSVTGTFVAPNTDIDTASPYETSVGYQAGNSTTGINNSFFGYQSGISNSSGTRNSALGFGAMYYNQTGIGNVAIGELAMQGTGLYTGSHSNVAVGTSALGLIGSNALSNTAIGHEAAYSTTTGYNNLAGGYQALFYNQTGFSNVALGYYSMRGTANYTLAEYNIGIGTNSLYSVSNSAASNVAIGYNAEYSLTTGHNNYGLGQSSLYYNQTGTFNVAIGRMAMYGTSAYTGSDSNVAIGDGALFSVGSSSDKNAALGTQALYSIATGSNNTGLGPYAGRYADTSSSDNVFIGYYSGPPSAETVSNKLYIDNTSTNTPLIWGDFTNDRVGINRQATTHALEVAGSAGLTTGTAWTNISDRRLKDIHGKYEYGLNEILQLNPVRFSYKKDNPVGHPSDKEIVGFVAQEVMTVIPDAVHLRDDGYFELNVDPIHWAAINAIKEVGGMSKMSASQIAAIEARLKSIERKVASIEEASAEKNQKIALASEERLLKVIEAQQQQIDELKKEFRRLSSTCQGKKTTLREQ